MEKNNPPALAPAPALTAENYYTPEMNQTYMSASQYKAFVACEAAAMAELTGEYVRTASTALLMGSYIDAHFEGALDLFKAQHPEIFKRDLNLKSEYVKAESAIARAEADPLFTALMAGRKQVIVSGEIAGVPFKGKIDSLLDAGQVTQMMSEFPELREYLMFSDGLIVDLKYMKDFADIWDDDLHQRVPFAQKWGYHYQAAIYRELVRQESGQTLPFAIAGATKEDTPDLGTFTFEPADLTATLYEIEDNAPRYQQIKQGLIQPVRCEKCAYCRATKKLKGFDLIHLC